MLSLTRGLVLGAKLYSGSCMSRGCLPVMMSTSMDLPAPLGPTIAKCSPSRVSKSTGSAIRHSGIRVTPFSMLIILCMMMCVMSQSFVILVLLRLTKSFHPL